MTKRLVVGLIVSALVVILPVLGNTHMLHTSQIWILIAFGVLASIFQPGYNPLTIVAIRKDRGTGAQIIWSVYVTQLAAVIESAYLRYPESVRWNTITVLALGGVTAGFALRTWAVYSLGKLFTMHIEIQSNHFIVRKGPYGIVRHPAYLGAFVMYVSTTLFLNAWISSLSAIPVLLSAFLRRIQYEEDMLKTEFGPSYRSYAREVKRFIPLVW